MKWIPKGGDPGLSLFTLAHPKLPTVPEGGAVLEVGYRDTGWAGLVKRENPSFTVTAVDWRKPVSMAGVDVRQGDILKQDFAPGSLDAVVGLSSFEHIGLGHYEGDPLAAYGDGHLLGLVRRWLKPGGWCYFDVPYDPTGYRLQGTKCRIYDDAALLERFGPHRVLGYVEPSVKAWIPKPTAPCASKGHPYYYVALLVEN